MFNTLAVQKWESIIAELNKETRQIVTKSGLPLGWIEVDTLACVDVV